MLPLLGILLSVSLISRATGHLHSICFGELELDLPTRYLHVQLVLEDGTNATESLGLVTAAVEAPSCRVSHDVVDRGDGSYVFRLRVAGSCPLATVTLDLEGVTVCNSPFEIRGKEGRNLNGENCNCPIPIDEWLEEAKCPPEPQLEDDLKPWENIDFEEVLWQAEDLWGGERHRRTYSVCHYQIIDNEIYRRCFGEYDGFKTFLDRVLRSVLNKMSIPNTEFLFNLGDYPLSQKEYGIPLVSWCGSEGTLDIVLPTYQFSDLVVQQYQSAHDIFAVGVPAIKWEDKIPKAIFRGRDSNELRLQLAKLSASSTDGLLDAGITTYFFHDQKEHTPPSPRIDFHDFFKYRYVLSVDGTVAAYRFPMLLAGNSVVFKADSQYYEHFYSKMKPYEHYVPFDGENVMQRIQWAQRTNPRIMLRKMRQFVYDHLQPKNMYCYYARFLKVGFDPKRAD